MTPMLVNGFSSIGVFYIYKTIAITNKAIGNRMQSPKSESKLHPHVPQIMSFPSFSLYSALIRYIIFIDI